MSITYEDVLNAREKIKDAVILTPTVKATRLSLHLGIDLYLKLENLQHTSSFKARGALNKLLSLSDEQREKGVIACSAGNHAQGVAYNATRLGIPSTIIMPKFTPFNKIKRTEDFGAKVILYGNGFDESVGETMRIAEEENLTFIHPFDDDVVIAGQGTLGLEMLEQVPDLDVVVVPIGGGGMIAGVATAIKGINPDVEVIGAQAENFDAMLAMKERRPFTGGDLTIAEGIAVKTPSEKDFKIIDGLVDKIFTASEREIEIAIYNLLNDEKLVAEGAAGVGLAVIKKNIDYFKGKKVGMVLCGGNIDSRTLSTLILRGLIREGRITRLIFEIDDTPGQLSDISRIIGSAGANVIEVIHQRMMQTVSLKRAELEVVIEARDRLHVDEIIQTLEDAGFSVKALRDV
ncbi:MAG: threonine ammonia-lyase [Alphaproteobacteria bacterium]|nr:threonine ammonia-lyase [Alphaproteobacteria bacterium]